VIVCYKCDINPAMGRVALHTQQIEPVGQH
jgi:hypothetical protein